MSHGGPECAYREADGTVTAECSEYSDVCEYGEHKKCTGHVEHRMVLQVIDRATGGPAGLIGNNHPLVQGHMCMCRCHWGLDDMPPPRARLEL